MGIIMNETSSRMIWYTWNQSREDETAPVDLVERRWWVSSAQAPFLGSPASGKLDWRSSRTNTPTFLLFLSFRWRSHLNRSHFARKRPVPFNLYSKPAIHKACRNCWYSAKQLLSTPDTASNPAKMGGQVSKMMGKIFGTKEMRILMLGLDAAGKTSTIPP